MYGLFNRSGAVQSLFADYKEHRRQCELAIKNCLNHDRFLFADLQRRNVNMTLRFKDLVKDHSKNHWNTETPLDILSALNKLNEFGQTLATLIHPKQEYQLRSEANSGTETSARMKRAMFEKTFTNSTDAQQELKNETSFGENVLAKAPRRTTFA